MAFDTLTAGQLKGMLKDVPDDAEIFFDDGTSGAVSELPNATLKLVRAEGHGMPIAVLKADMDMAASPFEEGPNGFRAVIEDDDQGDEHDG